MINFEEILKNLKLGDIAPNNSSEPDLGSQTLTLGITAGLSLLKAFLAQKRVHDATEARELLINPNKYSELKIQGYSFSLNAPLVMGKKGYFNKTLQPNSKIRPKRLVTNVGSPHMVTLSALQIANVNVLIGESDDACIYGPNSLGLENEFPTLDTSTRMTMTGTYSGHVPRDFKKGTRFLFILTVQGPATLCGNG
jgi:hypothetical protein